MNSNINLLSLYNDLWVDTIIILSPSDPMSCFFPSVSVWPLFWLPATAPHRESIMSSQIPKINFLLIGSVFLIISRLVEILPKISFISAKPKISFRNHLCQAFFFFSFNSAYMKHSLVYSHFLRIFVLQSSFALFSFAGFSFPPNF